MPYRFNRCSPLAPALIVFGVRSIVIVRPVAGCFMLMVGLSAE